jgi:threonine synthase
MRYISTRGLAPALDFRGATVVGLANDGGLYVPEAWPRGPEGGIAALRALPYAEAAARIAAPFVGDALSADELSADFRAAYAGFVDPHVAPLTPLGPGEWLMELHHGPTLAFKDIALQWLGRLFARFLGGRQLTILGATSGDTGSAAIHALAGLPQVTVVMLHPHGRVSEVQRRQMTTVTAPNIHNLALTGDFDDCQRIVKAILKSPPGGAELGAVNSINWARLLAQVVYYWTACARLGGPAAFSVPTGNFGDVFAGYVAARMGAPVARLIVATNGNDILHRALSAGDYSRGAVVPTTSPSMDIQVSSNFERLLFDLWGRDAGRTRAEMGGFDAGGRLALDAGTLAQASQRFASAAVSEAEAAGTMRSAWHDHGVLIDPHTAVGLAAGRRVGPPAPGVPMVTLATAHPAKFPDAVRAATGVKPPVPDRLATMLEGEERMTVLPASEAAVRGVIAELAGLGRAA